MSLCCPHRLLAWGESVVLWCQTMAVAVLEHMLVAFKVEHEWLGGEVQCHWLVMWSLIPDFVIAMASGLFELLLGCVV